MQMNVLAIMLLGCVVAAFAEEADGEALQENGNLLPRVYYY